MTPITEAEFLNRLRETLVDPTYTAAESVTGPGRSGTLAAIYASFFLKVEFVPFGREPRKAGPIILIDIAATTMSGLTRLGKRYKAFEQIHCLLFDIEQRMPMWFELEAFDQPSVRVFTPPPAAPACDHRPLQHYCPNCGAL